MYFIRLCHKLLHFLTVIQFCHSMIFGSMVLKLAIKFYYDYYKERSITNTERITKLKCCIVQVPNGSFRCGSWGLAIMIFRIMRFSVTTCSITINSDTRSMHPAPRVVLWFCWNAGCRFMLSVIAAFEIRRRLPSYLLYFKQFFQILFFLLSFRWNELSQAPKMKKYWFKKSFFFRTLKD